MKHSVHSDEWLFRDPVPHYPDVPGSKVDGTSAEAAKDATPANSERKRLVLEALTKFGPMAMYEVADRLKMSTYSVAPVLSQLRKLGMIKDSGRRHVNPSGSKAIVWQIV